MLTCLHNPTDIIVTRYSHMSSGERVHSICLEAIGIHPKLLKRDFGISIGGLDPLPSDEHGINIRRVFRAIRQTVMTKSRGGVCEDACPIYQKVLHLERQTAALQPSIDLSSITALSDSGCCCL